MRLLWLTLLLLMSSSALAQQNVPTVTVDTGNAVTGGNTGGGAANSGGSSQVPQGFGAGGQSDNLDANFGERGTTNETTGFIGGNANALQGGFVGQNQTVNGNAQNNAFGNRGQFGNLGGFQNGGRAGFGQQLQRQATRRIRTRLVLPADFAAEFRQVAAPKIQSRLTTQFQGINAAQAKSKVALGSSRVFANAKIEVIANDRTVILRGQVGSDRERKLAERIAKLEPGVDRVENQLVVAAPNRS